MCGSADHADASDVDPGAAEPLEFARLLERARSGEAAAIEALLGRHLPALRAFVQRRGPAAGRTRESLDDLVQSTCREVLQHLEGFDDRGGGEGAFAGWLCATAARKIVDRQRFQSRQRRDRGREVAGAELAEELRASRTPSRDAEIEERRRLLSSALLSLPDHYQHVLRLAYFEGWSRADIAAHLGKPGANAVQTLLARALARLGNTLRRELEA